jgi:ferredoxin-type protein NapH
MSIKVTEQRKYRIRQRIRKTLILMSFFLFPILLNYFSPIFLIAGINKGIATIGLFVVLGLFVSSIVLNRMFCGWLCPVGGLSECSQLVDNTPATRGPYRFIKYGLLLITILLIKGWPLLTGGLNRINLFYLMDGPISTDYILYYFVLFAVFGFTITMGRRAFCHYVCIFAPFIIWGNKIGEAMKLSGIGLKKESHKCTECTLCNIKCEMSLNVMDMVKNGTLSHSECIMCGECVDVCKDQAIMYRVGKKK